MRLELLPSHLPGPTGLNKSSICMAQLALSWRWFVPLDWTTSENLVIFCPCCAFGSACGTISSLNIFWIKDKPVLTKQNSHYLISPLKFCTGISLKYLFVNPVKRSLGKQQEPSERLELHILTRVWTQEVL